MTEAEETMNIVAEEGIVGKESTVEGIVEIETREMQETETPEMQETEIIEMQEVILVVVWMQNRWWERCMRAL